MSGWYFDSNWQSFTWVLHKLPDKVPHVVTWSDGNPGPLRPYTHPGLARSEIHKDQWYIFPDLCHNYTGVLAKPLKVSCISNYIYPAEINQWHYLPISLNLCQPNSTTIPSKGEISQSCYHSSAGFTQMAGWGSAHGNTIHVPPGASKAIHSPSAGPGADPLAQFWYPLATVLWTFMLLPQFHCESR